MFQVSRTYQAITICEMYRDHKIRNIQKLFERKQAFIHAYLNYFQLITNIDFNLLFNFKAPDFVLKFPIAIPI